MNTTISIPKNTKSRAQEVAKKYDMTVSTVARMLLNDFADGKIEIRTFSVPDDRMIKGTTKKVLDETDLGKDLNKVGSADELFSELDI